MTASNVFLLLLVVACPLMMMWMMRGGHGHGGHRAGHAGCGRHGHDYAEPQEDNDASTEELHRRREELDRQIEEREESERTLTGAPR